MLSFAEMSCQRVPTAPCKPATVIRPRPAQVSSDVVPNNSQTPETEIAKYIKSFNFDVMSPLSSDDSSIGKVTITLPIEPNLTDKGDMLFAKPSKKLKGLCKYRIKKGTLKGAICNKPCPLGEMVCCRHKVVGFQNQHHGKEDMKHINTLPGQNSKTIPKRSDPVTIPGDQYPLAKPSKLKPNCNYKLLAYNSIQQPILKHKTFFCTLRIPQTKLQPKPLNEGWHIVVTGPKEPVQWVQIL